MGTYAHVVNGTVTNVILADDPETAEALVPGGIAVDTDGEPVGIGWTHTPEGGLAPPPTPPGLYADRTTITAGGTDFATVSYHPGDPAPTSVTFTVNGSASVVTVVDGVAVVEVTSATVGSIDVTVNHDPDALLTITATGA